MKASQIVAITIFLFSPLMLAYGSSINNSFIQIVKSHQSTEPSAICASAPAASFGRVVPNRGQIPHPEVLFSSGSVYFTASGVIFCLRENAQSHAVECWDILRNNNLQTANQSEGNQLAIYYLDFPGSNPIIPSGHNLLFSSSNFFLGNASSKWISNVPNYGGILYENLYTGIDLVFLARSQGLKYEFRVAPGADPGQIRMRYTGAQLSLDDNVLLINTPVGTVHDTGLVFYQKTTHGKETVSGNMVIDGQVVSFRIKYDPVNSLVIDPYIFSTYLGGGEYDEGQSLGVDGQGNIVVTGTTLGDFPTTPGCYKASELSGRDFFISKFNSYCTKLLFSTYLGGKLEEAYISLKIGPLDEIYISGSTNSSDFPITLDAYDSSFNGDYDVFISRISADGSELVYSTYLGGPSGDWCKIIDIDPQGSIYVTGGTSSGYFYPYTEGALLSNISSSTNLVFVTKLQPDGRQLAYSALIGGYRQQDAISLFVNSEGNAIVAGETNSPDFPITTGVFQARLADEIDAFVFELSHDGVKLLHSTFIGGTSLDRVSDIVVGTEGCIYLTGYTDSGDFPTTSRCIDNTLTGETDGFLVKISPDLSQIVYSTYIGGNGWETLESLALASDGSVVVVGETRSSDLPVSSDALQTQLIGHNNTPSAQDGFILMLNSNGMTIMYCSYLGGNSTDSATVVIQSSIHRFCIAGITTSPDFPTTSGAYSRFLAGKGDVFITGFSLPDLPTAPLLTAHAGNRHVILSWVPPLYQGHLSISGYNIYKGDSPDRLTFLSTVGNETTLNDSGLANGVIYFYTVSAVTAFGEGYISDVVSASPGTVPGEPQGLRIKIGKQTLDLTWEPPTDNGGAPVMGYYLYKSVNNNSPERLIVQGNTTQISDTDTLETSIYAYYISTFNLWGEGNHSQVVIGSPDQTPPQIEIINPEDGCYVTSEELVVTGIAFDTSSTILLELSLDNSTWKLANGTWNWSGTVILKPGANRVYARAMDSVGNQNETSISIWLDIQDPILNITYPQVGARLTLSAGHKTVSIEFKGEAIDDLGIHLVELKKDGGNWEEAYGRESWNQTLILGVGTHSIFIRAIDLAGRETITEIQIEVEPATNISVLNIFHLLIILFLVCVFAAGYLIYSRNLT